LSKIAAFFKIEIGGWLTTAASFGRVSIARQRIRTRRAEQGVARFFRFVEKKRGARRTGSNLIGSLGEAIFCGSLFLLGTLLLSVIIATQLVQPEPEQFAFGLGRWLLILVTASSVVLGGGGLIWTVLRVGTSVERRSAMASQAAESDIVSAAVPRSRNFPTLPSLEGLTNSPGIELAYRLPSTNSPGWRLLVMTIFAMLWNFVVCLLTVSVISAHIAGRHDWLFTVLLLPFWGVCYWSVRSFLQLLLLNSGMGQTTLEISDLPLVPGREYQAVIAQHGHVAMRSLAVWLVCEEEATFTQGTDIRTEAREVFRQMCFERRDFRIEPGIPFTDTCNIAVPATAMHSFQSAHNLVRWKLVVRGEAETWPLFERGFPIVVYPGETTMQLEVGSHVTRNALKTPALAAATGAGA
jgi:hypothetical protein